MADALTNFEQPDWPFVQNSSITLFKKREFMADAISILRSIEYKILEVSCCHGAESFFEQVSNIIGWEELFGYSPWNGNLDAFNDGIGEFPFGPSKRAVLVINDFHILAADDRRYATELLDVMECNARDLLLESKILVTFVQTEDASYETGRIGARAAHWNSREWLLANRGLA